VSDFGEPPASAQALVQFFMTFFITFYNKHCFSRYNKLYDECMKIMDGAIFFVYEMTVSLGHTQLESHRVQATKYILATIYTFFMGITGGELTPKEWHECERKGLLTKAETEALAEYPGHSYTLVLSTWTMQVIDDALENDCVWTKRSQRIAHLHNRLNNNIIGMLSACHTVGHIVACPIPFPYYHLMNLVLVLNFILVACVLALLQSLFTIIPYMVVVLIFLGLREVATQLADPFGDDAVDFPVAEFLNYVTDQIVCLLETFNRMDTGMLRDAVAKERGFTSAQLLRQVDKQQLYKASGINFLDSSFNWHKAKALNKFDEDENPVTRLRGMFKNPQEASAAEFLEHADDAGLTEEDVALQLQSLHSRIQSGRQELEGLQKQIAELEAARPPQLQDGSETQPSPSRQISKDSALQTAAQEDRRAAHHHHHHHHHIDYEDDFHDDVSEGSVRFRSRREREAAQQAQAQQLAAMAQAQQTDTALAMQQAPADFTSMANQIRSIKASARGESNGTPLRAKSSGDFLNGRNGVNGKTTASFAEARARLERVGHAGPSDEDLWSARGDGQASPREQLSARDRLDTHRAAAARAQEGFTGVPSQAPGAALVGRPAVPSSNGVQANGSSEAANNSFADARAEIRRALEATDKAARSSSRERRRSPAASDASSTRRRRSKS